MTMQHSLSFSDMVGDSAGPAAGPATRRIHRAGHRRPAGEATARLLDRALAEFWSGGARSARMHDAAGVRGRPVPQ